MKAQEKSIRQQQVQNNIQRFLLNLFQEELTFEGMRDVYVSVAKVDLSRDIRNAMVFIDILGGKLDDKQKFQIIKQLNKQVPQIRHLMTEKIKLKYVPEIEFRLDKGSETTLRVSQIIEKEGEEFR